MMHLQHDTEALVPDTIKLQYELTSIGLEVDPQGHLEQLSSGQLPPQVSPER